MFNLSDVKMPGEISDGTYLVRADTAEVKETKAGTGKYIKVGFIIEDTGDRLYHMFNIENSNAKAVQIGLGQLKQFVTFAGHNPEEVKDPIQLCGMKCLARIKNKTDDYGTKPVIAGFKKEF
jgi:hypothetical protein